MDWILDNIRVVVTLAIVVAYIVRASKGKSKEEPVDPQAAERARKIQEEIRRKILERQQQADPSSPRSLHLEEVEPPEHEHPMMPWEIESEEEKPIAAPAVAPAETFIDHTAQYEAQMQKVQEDLARARALRKRVSTTASIDRHFPKSGERATSSRFIGDLRADLADPASIRRAFVLKEILDTPIGLR